MLRRPTSPTSASLLLLREVVRELTPSPFRATRVSKKDFAWELASVLRGSWARIARLITTPRRCHRLQLGNLAASVVAVVVEVPFVGATVCSSAKMVL